MPKEELLISLLKSEQSIAELHQSKSNTIGIEKIKKKINVLRNNLKEIRKKFPKKEKIDEYFREQKKKNETKQEKREKKQEE